jgi:glycosyltransferase involved in cell wall biosynthesis
VHCIGRVTDAELAGLYAGCLAVCIPSVAEGFGLPVVEAAAAGAPVLASDLPVFREITDAVMLHAPVGCVEGWAAALEQAAEGTTLRCRAAERTRAVARRYTWSRAAAITLAAYQRASREVPF